MKLIKLFVCINLLIGLGAVHGAENLQIANTRTWPVELGATSGKLKIYQPTVESLSGTKLSIRAAISFQPSTDGKIFFGALWLETLVDVDRQNRIITCRKVDKIQIKLPENQQNFSDAIKEAVQNRVSSQKITLSLDTVLALLKNSGLHEVSDNVKNTVPKVIVKYKPAILVTLDGQPTLVKGTAPETMRVINTPFFIAMDLRDKQYYLKGGDNWYTTANIFEKWNVARTIPENIQTELKSAAPSENAQETPEAPTATQETPEIVVVDKPAELISFSGQPRYEVIGNTSLMFIKNCNQKLFFDIDNQIYYVLFSGRWYKTGKLDGQWSFIPSTDLPADFKRIPDSSPEASVLVHVAGTEDAQEAVLSSCIPQTVAVKKTVTVEPAKYDGKPEFVKIEGTNILYAKNATTPMLLIDGIYYNCRNAVWYAAKTATSILKVAASIPEAILGIPPSSPVYYVKYVKVYDVTPDVVYVGYTPGYVGTYVSGNVIVYGTGYVYTPWYSTIYIPRPATFGFSFHYNSRTDSWGFSVGRGGPCGWVGFGYSSWGGWYGGGHWGYGGCWGGYGPHGGYSRWGNNNVYVDNRHNNININNNHNISNNRIKNDTRWNEHKNDFRRQDYDRGNHLLTDKSGNVYRRDKTGQWQQRDKSNWRSMDHNDTSRFLNQEDRSWQRGEQRQRDFQSWRGGDFGRSFGGRHGRFR